MPNEKEKSADAAMSGWNFWETSVLSIVVSSYLFHQFPELPEGELTKAACFFGL